MSAFCPKRQRRKGGNQNTKNGGHDPFQSLFHIASPCPAVSDAAQLRRNIGYLRFPDFRTTSLRYRL
jgi:hypothetical protein